MPAHVTVVIDLPALNQFRSWNGSLGQSFDRLLKETLFRAKVRAPKKTMNMVNSLGIRRGGNPAGKGLTGQVGSWTVKYTLFMEEGTAPHEIHAKNAPKLVFFWPKAGKVVAYKSVHHPGTKPYNFLKDGLEAAMNMWERGG